MVALCQAVEVLLGGVTFQTAADSEYLDGGEALLETAAQGLVHCLGIVHLAVAYRALDAAETQPVGADLSDKVLGGDELDTVVPDVAARHRLGVRMLSRQFQLRRKRTDGRLHSVAFMEPEGCAVEEFCEACLQFALCHVLMADAVTLQLRESEFLFRCQFGIEQWLPVLIFLGAGMEFEFYSVSLAWHNLSFSFLTAKVAISRETAKHSPQKLQKGKRRRTSLPAPMMMKLLEVDGYLYFVSRVFNICIIIGGWRHINPINVALIDKITELDTTGRCSNPC